MRSKHHLGLLTATFSLSLLSLGVPLTAQAQTNQTNIIAQSDSDSVICESNHNKLKRCPMNTQNGVILMEQLSQGTCEGNWDYGDGYVEVRNGCRAKFAQGQKNERHGNNNVTCESGHNRSQRCSMNTKHGVVLVRQLSRTSCDGNWDYGDGYVEVRNGCRGEFARGNNNRNNNNNSSNNNNNSSNNGMQKGRAAYETILVDESANFVIGIPEGATIYINCNDVTRIEGDKRVFAMDSSGRKGYILTSAVDGVTCNW